MLAVRTTKQPRLEPWSERSEPVSGTRRVVSARNRFLAPETKPSNSPDGRAKSGGVKGVGEIGIVGVPAAIANAVYHATGKRVRELPITLDKLLQ
jgi:hypothetical protein